jgi:hypothetical protein
MAWLAVGLASAAHAQTPQGTGFTYQGRLSEGAAPASGAYDFQFVLYDAATGGSQVGPALVREDVAVTSGLFTVVLDFGPVFAGNLRFLDVAVRPGASTGAFVPLTPRQDLTSTPAALFSATVPWGGIGGKPAGFADGVDDDSGGTVTSVGAGPGLMGGPITASGTLAVAFGGTGAATSAARSDHTHDATYVRNGTAPQPGDFNITGGGTAAAFAAATHYSLGGTRILARPGTNNLFAGAGAGAAHTTGVANAFFGANAGAANATGGSNSFFGFNAGRHTTSSNNSFFGDAAGFSNTTGGGAFFGFLAGFNNSTGTGNSFFGGEAGRDNTTGNGHSFFGEGAGRSNTTSINNSFFGRAAGISNTTGAVNSFFGENSGSSNTTGGGNVFVGRDAAFFNVSGSRNVVVGSSTAHGNTTGSDLTVVGTFANVGADGLSFATALGAGATVGTSNTLVLGRPADTVRAPGSMTVSGLLRASDLGAGNFGLQVVGSPIGGGAVAHNLYIRQLNQPEGNLHLCWRPATDGVAALLVTTCTAPFSAASGRADVRPLVDGLARVRRLRPVTFSGVDGGGRGIGLDAEDVSAEPLLAPGEHEGEDAAAERLIAVLVSAIQAQQAQIEGLRALVCASRPTAGPCAPLGE